MYFEADVGAEIGRFKVQEAEREATLEWRTRHLRSKESQVLTTIVTAVLGLFLR
jgi:hypothetical protein